MPLRQRIFIVISLIVLIILGVSMVLLISNKNQPKENENNENQISEIDNTNFTENILPVQSTQPTVIPEGMPIKPATSEQIAESSIRQLAKVYVERLNTYSSENNFQNIKDVESFVTNNLWKKISSRMSAKTPTSTPFVSVTTDVLSIMDSEIRENGATVTMKARKITEKSGTTTTAYLDYTITLIRSGSNWLVSEDVSK